MRKWANDLPRGGSVLDLGCGHGVPISEALIEAGLIVYGVDASPSMIAAFRARFPGIQTECSAVESSSCFGRTFDGVVAWGLMFLLVPEAQQRLIHKVSGALTPGGRFLFTSPWQMCEWRDVLTGRTSRSLGAEEYRRMLDEEGFVVTGEMDDEAGNHYYLASKR